MAAISLKVGAGKAFRELGKVERALAKLGEGGSASKTKAKETTNKIRSVIAKSVAIHASKTFDVLLEQTPSWSGFLKSNWKIAQGRMPSFSPAEKGDVAIDKSTGWPVKNQFAPPARLDANTLDGTRYQVIYNNTSYAEEVALGLNPLSSTGRIVSGGGPDWFLVTGQTFEDRSNYLASLRLAIRDVRL